MSDRGKRLGGKAMGENLDDGINIKNADTLAGRVLIGFECTECGTRVRNIGDGRICEDCSNFVWDRVVDQ